MVIPMLQLPHFDPDLLKRIGRRKVKTLQDLFSMPASERKEVYAFGGKLILRLATPMHGMSYLQCPCAVGVPLVLLHYTLREAAIVYQCHLCFGQSKVSRTEKTVLKGVPLACPAPERPTAWYDASAKQQQLQNT